MFLEFENNRALYALFTLWAEFSGLFGKFNLTCVNAAAADRHLTPRKWWTVFASRVFASHGTHTLTVLSTEPEKRRPLETANVWTAPWCRTNAWVQMLSWSRRHTCNKKRIGSILQDRWHYRHFLTRTERSWEAEKIRAPLAVCMQAKLLIKPVCPVSFTTGAYSWVSHT